MMKAIARIPFGAILGTLCLSPILISCTAPEQQARQTVEEIEEVTDIDREDVATAIESLETQVNRAVEEAETLSSQELQPEDIRQELNQIRDRLSAAVDLPEEELKAELQQSADRLDNLIARVDEAAEKAAGETKDQLEAYSADLKELKEETVRAIEQSG
ncbi:MAG: hypothetical protein ACP5D7_04985 [Limnospira sp.]